MTQPIVIAYHLIWTIYGWWLPNDPRGSGSHLIRNDTLADLGALHQGRKRVQPAGVVIREFYADAAERLSCPLLTLNPAAIDLVAATFAQVIAAERYTCYACAIMPDHVHILIRKHKHQAEDMIANLRLATRIRLHNEGMIPMEHPVWGGPGWKVFLDHPDEIRRTIGYVDDNPKKSHLPAQLWPFVIPYDGWPLHPGHSPNSPYAVRLRAAGRYPFKFQK